VSLALSGRTAVFPSTTGSSVINLLETEGYLGQAFLSLPFRTPPSNTARHGLSFIAAMRYDSESEPVRPRFPSLR